MTMLGLVWRALVDANTWLGMPVLMTKTGLHRKQVDHVLQSLKERGAVRCKRSEESRRESVYRYVVGAKVDEDLRGKTRRVKTKAESKRKRAAKGRIELEVAQLVEPTCTLAECYGLTPDRIRAVFNAMVDKDTGRSHISCRVIAPAEDD